MPITPAIAAFDRIEPASIRAGEPTRATLETNKILRDAEERMNKPLLDQHRPEQKMQKFGAIWPAIGIC